MQAERIFASWLRTRRAMRRSAKGLVTLREKQWVALQPSLARTPALAAHAGKPLADFPITDCTALRRDYGEWNSLGLSHGELCVMADDAEAATEGGDLSAGWSTGSVGGRRGLFLANRAERADYIGQSLARLLPPRALLRRQRIALHLRAGNALYSDAGRARYFFSHFPLTLSPADAAAALSDFAPTILIAPPHRLIAFAEAGLHLPSLRHLFYGSEPLSAAERAFVADRMHLFPRAIYQATEGFLGAECEKGCLHLNDHSLAIELEAMPGTRGFRPIITDLRRTSQPIVRLRGDDYLELDEGDCSCGYGGRAIQPIQGRTQDLWRLQGRCITPPQVVGAVERALGGAQRWQAAADREGVILKVAPACPVDLAGLAANALARLIEMPVALRHELPDWSDPKRRKVVWNGG